MTCARFLTHVGFADERVESREGLLFREIDEVGRFGGLFREDLEIRQHRFQAGQVGAAHERREPFVGAPLCSVEGDQTIDR